MAGRFDLGYISVKFQLPNFSQLSKRASPSFWYYDHLESWEKFGDWNFTGMWPRQSRPEINYGRPKRIKGFRTVFVQRRKKHAQVRADLWPLWPCARFTLQAELMPRYIKKLYQLLKLIPCLWSDSCFVLFGDFKNSLKMIVISKTWTRSFGKLKKQVWKLKFYRNVAKIKSTCN